MGRAYASKGMFDEAVKEFELCLRIDPQYEEALNDICRIEADKVASGKLSTLHYPLTTAVEKYRQTVQKRVDFFEGLHNLGLAYFNKGVEASEKEQKTDNKESITASHQPPATSHYYFELAVETLEKACKIKPQDLEAKSNLATAYAYYGDIDKAIELCKEILKENPQMTKTKNNLELFSKVKETLNRGHGNVAAERSSANDSKADALPLQENENEVTRFIQETFHDPMVQESIMMSGAVEFEKTKDGIKPKMGYLGSSQPIDKLKPAEIQALEALRMREIREQRRGDSVVADPWSAKPEFVFAENISDGYTIKYQGKAIRVRHITGGLEPPATSHKSP